MICYRNKKPLQEQLQIFLDILKTLTHEYLLIEPRTKYYINVLFKVLVA